MPKSPSSPNASRQGGLGSGSGDTKFGAGRLSTGDVPGDGTAGFPQVAAFKGSESQSYFWAGFEMSRRRWWFPFQQFRGSS